MHLRRRLGLAVLITAAIIAPTSGSSREAVPPAVKQTNCHKQFTGKQFNREGKRIVHSAALTQRRKRRLRLMIRCSTRPGLARRKLARWLRWRRKRPWTFAFRRFSPQDRAWAINTSSCEAGMVPSRHDRSGEYHGAFQFLLSTARKAGFTADPHTRSWHEQAVRSIRWRNIAGDRQWPRCGH